MQNLRAGVIIFTFLVITALLMPLQYLFLLTDSRYAKSFPHWYHRQMCRLFGIRLIRTGHIWPEKSTLLISNHTSWMDIPVVSAVAPASFIAKKEVASWPMINWLAKLQRTVFVDRKRRTDLKYKTSEISIRLAQGDTIVLFAEGTSNDGNYVRSFKSSLLGSLDFGNPGQHKNTGSQIQTMAIVYTKIHGIPLGRRYRPLVAWYGDMELPGHLWELMKNGPLDVHIMLSDPIPMDQFKDRKQLAQFSEQQIRNQVSSLLRPTKGVGTDPKNALPPL